MSVGNKLSFGEILRHFFLCLIPSLVESSYRRVVLTYRSTSVAVIANSNMLFSLLSGWNNPPPKAIDDSDNQSENMNPNTFQKSRPSVEKPLLKPGVHPIVSEQLKLGVDLFRGRLKHRDAAILIMRFLIKSDVRLSEPSSSFSCQDYLQFLDKLELLDLNTASFGAKHVLSVEGLEFSGKSTLINNIYKRVSKVKVINRQELPDVIHNHSETACIAWEFLENYRIAMEIIDGDDDVVLIEDYFHHFLTKYLRKFVKQEEEVNNVPYPSFAWPFDLPMPELVLFLTTTTDTRIERKQDEELSSGPTTIVPGATMSEPVQDAIANAIFAAIRGPSTVGIDTSPAPMSVYATVLEALEYFGFYCISRNVTHAGSSDGEVSRRQSTELSAPVPTHQASAAADDDYSFLVGQDEPMLPPDVITNRRISMGRVSMGVYGMYSKF